MDLFELFNKVFCQYQSKEVKSLFDKNAKIFDLQKKLKFESQTCSEYDALLFSVNDFFF